MPPKSNSDRLLYLLEENAGKFREAADQLCQLEEALKPLAKHSSHRAGLLGIAMAMESHADRVNDAIRLASERSFRNRIGGGLAKYGVTVASLGVLALAPMNGALEEFGVRQVYGEANNAVTTVVDCSNQLAIELEVRTVDESTRRFLNNLDRTLAELESADMSELQSVHQRLTDLVADFNNPPKMGWRKVTLGGPWADARAAAEAGFKIDADGQAWEWGRIGSG